MTTTPMRSAATAAILVAVAAATAPLTAQYLDPDRCWTCRDKVEHFAAGAGLDILARGPWVAASFRNRAWKRVAVTAVVATAWELIEMEQARRDGTAGQPGYGFSPLDVTATVGGAVAMELAAAGLRAILRE